MSQAILDTEAVGQPHPYHLVNPSIMPFLSSMAALLFVYGFIAWAKGYAYFMPSAGGIDVISAVDLAAALEADQGARGFAPGGYALIPGLMALLACMWFWWRDVIHEAMVEKAHSKLVKLGFRYGMILFIASEVMFFFAFFWAFISAAVFPNLAGNWPPADIMPVDAWHLPFTMTLVLLLSGTTVTWAHHAIIEGEQRDATIGLLLTVILGVIFTAIQAYEYMHVTYTFGQNVYSSAFFMATGFHGFHVLVGTTFLAVCLFRNMKGHFKPDDHFGFEAAAWYWHFVDVVWLFLFVVVYWWGS